MKLSQALKQKNRLAGEMKRLEDILKRENSRRSDNVSKVSRRDVWQSIQMVSDELGILKAKIATANVGIYANLERMAELKSRCAFLTGLPKRVGPEILLFGRDQEKTVYTWDSFIDQERADELIVAYQVEIARLQDDVDTYNATTDI